MHLTSKGGYLNITRAKFESWQDDYPGVDILKEIDKANDWLEKHPSKRWKTLRGFERWLERASDEKRRKDNKPVYVPREQSTNPAYNYERDHPWTDRRILSPGEQDRANATAKRTLGEIRQGLADIDGGFSTTPDDIRPDQCSHTWGRCRYTGWDWCWDCGTYRHQHRPLDHSDYAALRRRSGL